jgi:hypothetical protein
LHYVPGWRPQGFPWNDFLREKGSPLNRLHSKMPNYYGNFPICSELVERKY